MVSALPKKNSLTVNPQKNGIVNRTHGHGEHNPWFDSNYSNYEVRQYQNTYIT